MERLSAKAYAKINLALDVTGRRADGYHLVSMIMQTLDLYDTVTVEKSSDPGIRMSCDRPEIPCGSDNLMVRAAEAFLTYCGIESGIQMTLEKRIPMAAGLAGGSSDAAQVLILLNRLFETGLSQETLQKIALPLGADIPYCILGGTALSEGIGEVLQPLPDCPKLWVLLCKPPQGADTRAVYKAWDMLDHPLHPPVKQGMDALQEGDVGKLCDSVGNSLSEETKKMLPVISDIEERMRTYGASAACMSGSGPTVFGIFREEETGKSAEMKLKEAFPGFFTGLYRPIGRE